MMKKFIRRFLLLILLSGGLYFLPVVVDISDNFWTVKQAEYQESRCDRPLEYSLGIVDSEFGISETDFLRAAREAEEIWEKESGKNLFEYTTDSSFKINLVFDERQKEIWEAERMRGELELLENKNKEWENKYQYLNANYQEQLTQYEKKLSAYEKRVKKYNKEVKKWNEEGGAPSDEYKDLEEEKKEIKKTLEYLEDERQDLNQTAEKINKIIAKENKTMNDYNVHLETYRQKYGKPKEFEKGLYSGNEINIYQFYEFADLRLTLAHELGHALGIGHVENSLSLMYYLIGDQNMDNPSLSVEDKQALEEVCQKKL